MSLFLLLPVATFIGFLILQSLLPRRRIQSELKERAINHVGLLLINLIVGGLLPFLSLVLVSHWAATHGLGLFNWLPISSGVAFWLGAAICVVALDFAIYWQHVATHKLSWLWRFHKVHHSDPDFEVSTAIRFHPVELVLSLVYKGLCVVVLGAPIAAVLIFEFLLLFGSQFSHSNTKLPQNFDSILRTTIATPDVHRIHHSVHRDEHDSNYGFFLIWWDKLFGTYTKAPRDSHEDMRIGLSYIQPKDASRLDKLLLMPIKRP